METIVANINDSTNIEVYYQDEISLDIDLSLLYIRCGQTEIQSYVDDKIKPEIDNYIETNSKPIVSEVINLIANPLVNSYLEDTAKPKIDEYTAEKLVAFNDNALAKQEAIDTQADIATQQALIATSQADNATNSANQASVNQILAQESAANAQKSADEASVSATTAQNYAAEINPSQFVHTDKSENISGQKTFKDLAIFNSNKNYKVCIKSQTIDINNAPTVEMPNQLYFMDKNEYVYSVLQANQTTSGNISFLLTTRNANGTFYSLGVTALADGTGYASAPNPPSNVTSNQIATASWVRSLLGTQGVFCTTTISDTQWSREWKNASGARVWLEQGGQFAIDQRGRPTVTLNKAFSNSNYIVITQSTQDNTNNTDNNANKVVSRTTTNFIVQNYEVAGNVLWYACGK